MWGIRTAFRVFAASQQRSVSMKLNIRTITEFHFLFEKILARNFSSFRAFCGPRHRPLLTRDGGAVVRWRKGRCVSKKAFDRSQKRSVSSPSPSVSCALHSLDLSRYPPSLLLQPISWTSLAVLIVGGGIAVLYVKYLKKEKEKGMIQGGVRGAQKKYDG